jgi:MYXO-CTERM domain-containing protein
MIALWVSLAWAACDPAAALPSLRAHGAQADYLCVAGAEEGKDLLLAQIVQNTDPTGKGDERLTRALVLWLLQRTDRAMDPAVVAKLSPDDRRLLADGIRARRGRASPAPDHVAIFQQLSWYEPDPSYTDARLRPVDRENLALVDPAKKPPPPPPQAPGDAAAPAPGADADGTTVTAQTPNLCGCASTSGDAGLVLAGLALLTTLRRSRR